ncbi:MAG: hypothetical protein JXB32_20185 [Deltaproteobacteria bacterium]|nr:hypothetical protein [Deltaproteobacteria bacterium]
MLDEGQEAHPVDAVVERRLRHAGLRRQVRSATDRLMRALGRRRHLWLRLEELLADCRMDREAAFFDIGLEHGRAAGRAEEFARGRPGGTPTYRALALRVREAAVNAGLPNGLAAAALLEAAWALVLDANVLDPRHGYATPLPKPRRRRINAAR